jgi:putative SOS response-associated peptidase YedK
MCYHISLSVSAQSLQNRFNHPVNFPFKPVYHVNGFSHNLFPVVTQQGIFLKSWGLAPSWCKDLDKVKEMQKLTLNCRIETALEKPSFKHLVYKKHCLVPSTGFFEARHYSGYKVPYKVSLHDYKIFTFAGFHEIWQGFDNSFLETFTILTTRANHIMKYVHNKKRRMPVILTLENEKRWLDPNCSSTQFVKLFEPFKEVLMKAESITNLVFKKGVNTDVPEVLDTQDYGEGFQAFLG